MGSACCSWDSTATRSTATAGRSRRPARRSTSHRRTGARRELAEETGYEAGSVRELFRFTLSNSVSDEVGVIYLATDLRAGTASPEPTEDLALRWATLDEVLSEIDAPARSTTS